MPRRPARYASALRTSCQSAQDIDPVLASNIDPAHLRLPAGVMMLTGMGVRRRRA